MIKDYMNIKFSSDDDLPLNKPLKFHNLIITITSIFEEDGKLYPLSSFSGWYSVWIKRIKNARIRKNWYFRRDWC